jgi:endoglucanase
MKKSVRKFKVFVLIGTMLIGLGISSCDGGNVPSEFNNTESLKTAPAPAGSVVSMYGRLKVVGNKVCSEGGTPVQLRGMSLFWNVWTSYYKASVVDNLNKSWGATIVRAAIANGSTSSVSDTVKIVDAAIANGIYVIIDWHSHNAETNQAQAITFFTNMATKYKDYPNVIYEIYNEPLGGTTWPVIKAYEEAVIAAIRATGTKNLIVAGTPNWSQWVDVASADPITTDPENNIAYTLHFYAATGFHQQPLRDKANIALSNGLALMVTEWGTCEDTGGGNIDAAQTRIWLDYLDQNMISSCNWSLNNKEEAASALTGNNVTGPWPDAQITTSGHIVLPYMYLQPRKTAQICVTGPLTIDLAYTNYSVYGLTHCDFHDRAKLINSDKSYGSIGAGTYNSLVDDQLIVGYAAYVGNVNCGLKTLWARDSMVYGNICAKANFTGRAFLTGPTGGGFKLVNTDRDTACMSFSVDMSKFNPDMSADVNVEPGKDRTLNPGRYGNVNLKGRNKLTLSSGEYHFNSYNSEPDVTIYFNFTNGPVVIYVKDVFQMKSRTKMLNPADNKGADPSKILVIAGTSSDVYIAPGVNWRGTLIAPNTGYLNCDIGNSGDFNGALWGNKVIVHQDTVIAYVGFDWNAAIASGISKMK